VFHRSGVVPILVTTSLYGATRSIFLKFIMSKVCRIWIDISAVVNEAEVCVQEELSVEVPFLNSDRVLDGYSSLSNGRQWH